MAIKSRWYRGYELSYSSKKDEYIILEPMKGNLPMGIILGKAKTLEKAQKFVDEKINEE